MEIPPSNQEPRPGIFDVGFYSGTDLKLYQMKVGGADLQLFVGYRVCLGEFGENRDIGESRLLAQYVDKNSFLTTFSKSPVRGIDIETPTIYKEPQFVPSLDSHPSVPPQSIQGQPLPRIFHFFTSNMKFLGLALATAALLEGAAAHCM